MENDPIPLKVLLGDSSGYLHLASKKGEAELPPDQFAIEGWFRLDSQNSSVFWLLLYHSNSAVCTANSLILSRVSTIQYSPSIGLMEME